MDGKLKFERFRFSVLAVPLKKGLLLKQPDILQPEALFSAINQ